MLDRPAQARARVFPVDSQSTLDHAVAPVRLQQQLTEVGRQSGAIEGTAPLPMRYDPWPSQGILPIEAVKGR